MRSRERCAGRAVVPAVALAALLAGGCSVAAPWADGDRRTVAEALPDELPRLKAFVAQERGLGWTQDVPVQALEEEAFLTALQADPEGTEEAAGGDAEEPTWAVGLEDPFDGRAETYAALGLTPSASAYGRAWEDGDATVTGFYDSVTHEVYLRGQTWTPLVEETLVHELVHALDDQHVDLDALPREGAGPEEATAATAVVEGSAESVTWAWYDALDADEVDAYERAWGDSAPVTADGDEPAYDPLLETLALFPYDYGFLAVDAVAADAGPEGVDDLLRDPLTTTEQVLAARPDPRRLRSLAPPVDVEAPAAPAGAEVLGTGGLGLYPLSLLPLAAGAAADGYLLDPADVVTYAWAGDAWTTWVDPEDEDLACTAVVVRLDDARGRDLLAEDLAGWAADAGQAGAAVTPVGESDLRLTGCGER
ncbi:hypothetical protein [Pseudokineococcus sp. 1T1Z-3]|uniref:hypothetical protein n=1 Tax=Pseudokineococcus sp. 1T1Z-3 TaxID=3132745 RepID=UPI0030AA3433